MKESISGNKIGRISRQKFVRWLVVFFVVSVSWIIYPYYYRGDLLLYRQVYDDVASMPFLQGYQYYRKSLSSSEYVHFVFIWLASKLVAKDIVMSLVNGVLAFLSFNLLRRWGAAISVAAIIVSTNFYFYVLYFSGERLKFGFLCAAIFFLIKGGLVKKAFWGLLTVFAHAQMLVVLAVALFRAMAPKFIGLMITGRGKATFLIASPLVLGAGYLMREQVMLKLDAYAGDITPIEFAKTLIFFSMSFFYAKNKWGAIFGFIPLLLAVAAVGGERVNMMSFFVFLFFALQYRSGKNLGVAAVSIYFALMGLIFLQKIVIYGEGFVL